MDENKMCPGDLIEPRHRHRDTTLWGLYVPRRIRPGQVAFHDEVGKMHRGELGIVIAKIPDTSDYNELYVVFPDAIGWVWYGLINLNIPKDIP